MQVQVPLEQGTDPFNIIHNARSSKASRSRKSSISVIDKDNPRSRMKKLRKMTLNPESIRHLQIRQIEQLHLQRTAAHSQKGEMKEESELNIDDFLDLGWPKRVQSEKELELESGIVVGIANERQLDYDCNFNFTRTSQGMDLELEMKE